VGLQPGQLGSLCKVKAAHQEPLLFGVAPPSASTVGLAGGGTPALHKLFLGADLAQGDIVRGEDSLTQLALRQPAQVLCLEVEDVMVVDENDLRSASAPSFRPPPAPRHCMFTPVRG
jgi:hypothetical protein